MKKTSNKVMVGLLSTMLAVSMFASTSLPKSKVKTDQDVAFSKPPLNIAPKDLCEYAIEDMYILSDSDECNDIRMALVNYLKLQIFYCPLEDDTVIIAQYNVKRIQQCEVNGK